MAGVPVVGFEDVVAAVTPGEAVARVREGFLRFTAGQWAMPPKVYLPSPPHGDFRAMPALGDGIAVVKWVSSFPGAAAARVPTVSGLLCVSDATTGALLMLLDARSVTALRTGAAAAVATVALAPSTATTAGIVGCGVHGAWAARCLAAVGYQRGTCHDPDPARAAALADELGWDAGDLGAALAADVVTCVTPGASPVLTVEALRPGLHCNMLGADGPGKAEATVDAVAACRVFCDDWAQAAHGGEIAGAVHEGRLDRSSVTDLGDVLAGTAPGRADDTEVTLFDSTGLAIQDLAIARAVLERWRAGALDAPTVNL